MSTTYADSGAPINTAQYDAVTQNQGQDPKGWGRYFYKPDDNGETTSLGTTYYSGSKENAFFHAHQLRLLPIAGQGITVNDYTTGHDDAQSNLQAVLKAFGERATLFYQSAGAYYCAFMLDCESDGGEDPIVCTDYLHGWLKGMAAGITDSSGNTLYGWSGFYSGQDFCNAWTSVVDCANSYGIRPKFLDVAHYVSSTVIPAWDEADTSPDQGTCKIAVGQVTALWQYYGNLSVDKGESYVDLDLANPNIDFHTTVGQYCPIPPSS